MKRFVDNTVKRWAPNSNTIGVSQLKTVIDEWVGGLGPPLAQWEVMRLVSPPE